MKWLDLLYMELKGDAVIWQQNRFRKLVQPKRLWEHRHPADKHGMQVASVPWNSKVRENSLPNWSLSGSEKSQMPSQLLKCVPAH